MTTNELNIHFPYSTIRSIANNNQCSNLSDESVRFLTLETTGIVQFLLLVSRKKPRKNPFQDFRFFLSRTHLNSLEHVDEHIC